MAFNFQDILGEMGTEMGERYVHQKISQHLREEIAKGESATDVVAKAIIRLRSNEYFLKIHALLGPRALGLTLVGVGTLLAKLLQNIDFDGLLPEDQSPIMKQVRYVLKHAAPALIVGAAEGGADSWEQDVRKTVGSVLTNPAAPGTPVTEHKPGAIDFAYDVDSDDGVDYWAMYGLLFPEWGVDGKLQLDTDGAYILAGVNGRKFAQDWRAAHKEHWEDIPVDPPPNDQQGGRGKNQNQNQNNNQPRTRRELVKKKVHKGTLVPLALAVTRIASTLPMDPELLALAKAALKPKDPSAPKEDKLDDGGLAFQLAWSITMSDKSEYEQRKGRDLLSDLAGYPSRINTLGKHFVLATGTDKFTDDQIKSIYEYVQTWMGATLTIENKIRHAFTQAKNIFEATPAVAGPLGIRLENAIGTVAHAAGKTALACTIGLTALFAMFLALVLFGAFGVNLDRPLIGTGLDALRILPSLLFLALAWNFKGWIRYLFVVFGVTTGVPGVVFLTAHFMEQLSPTEFAVALVAGGGILACIELLSFTAIQGLLSIVTRFFPNVHKDWLINKGRILIMFIAIHVGIFMILLSVKAPLLLRLLICVPTFFALASQMGLSGYEFGEEARLRARKTLRLFSALTILVFIAVIVMLVTELQGKSLNDVLGWISGSRIVQSVLILSGVGYVVAKVVRRMEEVSRETANGMPKEILYRRNWWLRSVGIILVLGLASWPWIESDINAHYAAKAPPSPLANLINQMTTPALQPIVLPPVPASVQAPAPTTGSGKRAVGSRRKNDKVDLSDCENLSFESRQALGCK